MTTASKILVSDFDSTMTRHDFYKLVIESLLPPGTHDYWGDYHAGRITHFEALRGLFAAIRAPEVEVFDVLRRMELDPKIPDAIAALREAGWEIVVTSAGCGWYIDRLLKGAGVALEVYSNPGRFIEGQGLLMEMPSDPRFRSLTLGVNKAGVVRQFMEQGKIVAFAGDSLPDAEAARLVNAGRRFAHSDLAELLRGENLAYHWYDQWSDIAPILLREA
jgi:2,3-diketo-5-methylthio-1-phosphopentane phosphatase